MLAPPLSHELCTSANTNHAQLANTCGGVRWMRGGGNLPIAPHTARVDARLLIGCTPRTGNLWFRRLLSGALGLPEYAAHETEEIAWQDLPRACIVSMHAHPTPEFRQFLTDRQFRFLTIMRHPLDVLISILQFSKREPATARWLGGEGGDESALVNATPLDQAFLDYSTSERASALLGVSAQWLPLADAVAHYEKLVANTTTELSTLLERLRLAPTHALGQVVEQNSIKSLRTSLATYSRHFWRGEPGLWRQLLPPQIALPIATHHQRLFEQLGYVCDVDPHITAQQALGNWLELCSPERTEDTAKPRATWRTLFRRRTS